MKLNLAKAFLVIAAVAVLAAVGCKKDDKKGDVIVPTGIEITPAWAELTIGQTATFIANVLPENASADGIKWSSSNTAVASVDGGRVTAIAEGSATIIATIGSISGTASVTVSSEEPIEGDVPVTGINVTNWAINMYVGDTREIEYTIEPENATNKNVTFSSANPAVATVSVDGVILGISEGSARITVTTVDGGFTSSCTITVAPAPDFPEQTYVNGIYYNPAIFDPFKVAVAETPAGKEKYSGDVVVPSTFTYNGVEYSVYGIDSWAFDECENLKSVTIEDGLENIGAWAFTMNNNLEKVSLPASFDYLIDGNPVFTASPKLEVTVDEANPKWYAKNGMLFMKDGDYGIVLRWIFEKNTGTVTIPDGTNVIGEYAVAHTNFDKLVIPASVNKIEIRFFDGRVGGSCKVPIEIELNWTTQEQVDAITTVESVAANFFFNDTDRTQVKVSVPKGTKSLYENHWLWGALGGIVERN